MGGKKVAKNTKKKDAQKVVAEKQIIGMVTTLKDLGITVNLNSTPLPEKRDSRDSNFISYNAYSLGILTLLLGVPAAGVVIIHKLDGLWLNKHFMIAFITIVGSFLFSSLFLLLIQTKFNSIVHSWMSYKNFNEIEDDKARDKEIQSRFVLQTLCFYPILLILLSATYFLFGYLGTSFYSFLFK